MAYYYSDMHSIYKEDSLYFLMYTKFSAVKVENSEGFRLELYAFGVKL